MNTDRDKFLTEAMGECWHEFICSGTCVYWIFNFTCSECGFKKRLKKAPRVGKYQINFSTWESFGKLWTWAIDQEWFYGEFLIWSHKNLKDKFGEQQGNLELLVNPDRFATAIYEYLTEATNHARK